MNVEYHLPAEKVERFVSSELSDSLAMTLSHCFSRFFNPVATGFRLLAKEGLNEGEVLDFQGAPRAEGVPSPGDWLVQFFTSFGNGADPFLLVEYWLLSPRSSVIKADNLPAVYHGDEVYFVIRVKDLGNDDGAKGLCTDNLVPLYHVFLIQGVPMPEIGSDITTEELEVLAAHVRAFCMGIYDGESYLVATAGQTGVDQ
jgi:hypothetical protein